MFVIAVFTEMPTPASCSETRVLTRTGYQIVTENEVYFVSKERFLKKYKDNLFITAGTKDRLLTFEEAQELREAVVRLEKKRLIKVKGSNLHETYDRDSAAYSLAVTGSDIAFEADRIRCDCSGNNNNIRIKTRGSMFNITSSRSTIDIDAKSTSLHLYVSDCFIELSGTDVEVMLIGNNNTVGGITEGITVISRGRKNEFVKKDEAPLPSGEKGVI